MKKLILVMAVVSIGLSSMALLARQAPVNYDLQALYSSTGGFVTCLPPGTNCRRIDPPK